jgi:uncharacterized repeat protein (TIGR01451 family)
MAPVPLLRRIAPAFAAVAVMFFLVSPRSAHAVGTTSGTIIESTASMTYKDANSNSYTATSNTVKATVEPVYAVSLSCGPDFSTNSSTTAYYACTVTNTGNAKNTFTLAATTPPGWTTVLLRDDGAGGGVADNGAHTDGETTVTGSTGEINPDASYKFFVATTVPAGTVNGTTAVSTLTVTGTGDGTAADDASDTMTTTALAPSLTVVKNLRNLTTSGAFGTAATAKPLQTLEYRVQVTNSSTDIDATEVLLQETLNANLEYVPGTMRYGATPLYAAGSPLNDAASGDADCIVQECGTGNYSGGVLTFRLGLDATESAGGALGTTKTVYVFFHAKVK